MPPPSPLHCDWHPCPLSISNRTCCHDHDPLCLDKQLKPLCISASLSLALSHLLFLCVYWQTGCCFRFRMSPLAPPGEALSSSRHSPCDVTMAPVVNLPLWRRQRRQTWQRWVDTLSSVWQRAPFAPSLITVCSAAWGVCLRLLTFGSELTTDMC